LMLRAGHWKNDTFHGQGKRLSKNGTVYMGGWRNGLRHGDGIARLAVDTFLDPVGAAANALRRARHKVLSIKCIWMVVFRVWCRRFWTLLSDTTRQTRVTVGPSKLTSLRLLFPEAHARIFALSPSKFSLRKEE
jgi:hypothetical protein